MRKNLLAEFDCRKENSRKTPDPSKKSVFIGVHPWLMFSSRERLPRKEASTGARHLLVRFLIPARRDGSVQDHFPPLA